MQLALRLLNLEWFGEKVVVKQKAGILGILDIFISDNSPSQLHTTSGNMLHFGVKHTYAYTLIRLYAYTLIPTIPKLSQLRKSLPLPQAIASEFLLLWLESG